jgi:hypothetical protein
MTIDEALKAMRKASGVGYGPRAVSATDDDERCRASTP